jgi:two-component system sensor histidine kinase KdpD
LPVFRLPMRILSAKCFLRPLAAAAITAVYALVVVQFEHISHTTLALVLVLLILLIATGWGRAEAVVASIVAALAFHYCYPPPFNVGFRQPQYWVALVSFLTTALTVSELSVRARKRAQEAERRRAELEKLQALGQAILRSDASQSAVQAILSQCVPVLGASAAAFYNRLTKEVSRAGPDSYLIPLAHLNLAAIRGAFHREESTGVCFVPVRSAGIVVGSLGVRCAGMSPTLLDAIASLLAIGLERAHALEQVAEAEMARKSEELRSVVLDAIAHDFRTPLTAIKAAVTSMMPDCTAAAPEQSELLTIINEETDRLNHLVGQAVEMSKVQTGMLRPEKRRRKLEDLVLTSLEELGLQDKGRTVEVNIPDSLPPVEMDMRLIKQVLKQLLDNADKYSPLHSPIRLSAHVADDAIVVSVADEGRGIPEDEQQFIFEKFYRGKNSQHDVPGTGMGLAIAKNIIEAHGGRLWLTSKPDSGSVFHFSLPVQGV